MVSDSLDVTVTVSGTPENSVAIVSVSESVNILAGVVTDRGSVLAAVMRSAESSVVVISKVEMVDSVSPVDVAAVTMSMGITEEVVVSSPGLVPIQKQK